MTDTDQAGEIMARIVSAYAARPDVGPDEIVALVARLKQELGTGTAGLAAPIGQAPLAGPPIATAEPALPIDQAVTEEKVFCLCCGKGFKMLKRHLGAEHGLTEAEYRRLYGLPEDMPLVAPSYSARKADYAKQAGLGKYSRDQAGHPTDPRAVQNESIS
ncbi:MucR family transcriptional regulator [Brevirhabdus pacifica]|uniref:MucR family transcriptional regulator n=1 Tax=Brevirhabdus pacifica TaxID=1267768 RepID=A0A1U7DGU2_9RHOB|nr:MucR family transcriptional regulator [Brevirhabdus pacifica]APX89220.1 MucR family transcriptional regulator [Brevirhabdus pacifica]PJJ86175.1 MucR family transcriptional regulator [Brevirhabdus pacifica]